jgi:seryl-tRNA synthetase
MWSVCDPFPATGLFDTPRGGEDAMFETRVALTAPIDAAYRAEVERRLFYLSSDIVGFELTEDNGRIREIVFVTKHPAEAAALGYKLAHVIETDIVGHVLAPSKVLWRNGERSAGHPGVYDDMIDGGVAVESGEGQVALGGTVVALMDHLDEKITGIVVRRFGAEEFRYPTLIPTHVLEEVGYIASFPHFLMFVTRLHGDSDVYREVVAGAGATDLLRRCDNVDYCLPPTMCFHTFHQFRGHRLAADENRVVTAKGKSFRFESRYARSLERLWDFTIREVVFLGERDFVAQARLDLMSDVFGYLEELGLSGYCEVANDPFFANEDTSGKIMSQRMLESKYELRADVGADHTIAVGSFNLHDQFFSGAMRIRRAEDELASTACAGFGLERLTYAFLCQFGLDPAGWPAAVRAAVPGA